MINTEAKRIQKIIEVLKRERPDYEQILDLFGKIMIKQAEFSEKAKVKPIAITKSAARSKLKTGIPLLNRENFHIDLSNASQLFRELCQMLKTENDEMRDGIEKIESALDKGELPLEDILQSILQDTRRVSELAEQLSLDKETIFMLAAISIRPSLEANAAYMRDRVEEALWSRNYCPVCGSAPAISELRKIESYDAENLGAEGAVKILHCSFCGTQWRAPRLMCAFCGNTDHESLKYLYNEAEKGYRIDVCEKCKKYIKTVDSSYISHEIIPPVEDMVTIHLDMIAEEKGYIREGWLVPYYGI